MPDFLEWTAFGVGTVGTVLWAVGYKWKGKPVEGWFWLVSALLWIAFAVRQGHSGLMARDLLGVALYVIGIFKVMRTKDPEQSGAHSPS